MGSILPIRSGTYSPATPGPSWRELRRVGSGAPPRADGQVARRSNTSATPTHAAPNPNPGPVIPPAPEPDGGTEAQRSGGLHNPPLLFRCEFDSRRRENSIGSGGNRSR